MSTALSSLGSQTFLASPDVVLLKNACLDTQFPVTAGTAFLRKLFRPIRLLITSTISTIPQPKRARLAAKSSLLLLLLSVLNTCHSQINPFFNQIHQPLFCPIFVCKLLPILRHSFSCHVPISVSARLCSIDIQL